MHTRQSLQTALARSRTREPRVTAASCGEDNEWKKDKANRLLRTKPDERTTHDAPSYISKKATRLQSVALWQKNARTSAELWQRAADSPRMYNVASHLHTWACCYAKEWRLQLERIKFCERLQIRQCTRVQEKPRQNCVRRSLAIYGCVYAALVHTFRAS